MAKITKRFKVLNAAIVPGKAYSLDEALKILKDNSKVKFVESIDVAVRLGVDAKKSDQQVRGSTVLPAGTGKSVRVAVFVPAGAKAEEGATLEEVKAVAEKVIANVRTMGMAIEPCTVPAAGKPGFELADDEMEIGIGIHGEPGTHREKLASADKIADALLEKILADIDYKGHEVAVIINGMGATPLMELYIVNNFVQDYLAAHGVKVYDTMVGNYMTSIEMAGFSITLLRLDDELKKLYDAKADTPALKR